MNAVDANVFVYSLDASEPAKQARAQQLVERLARAPDETILPWQVAGERKALGQRRKGEVRLFR
jgi:predicted nucleic acid-binding protein